MEEGKTYCERTGEIDGDRIDSKSVSLNGKHRSISGEAERDGNRTYLWRFVQGAPFM